MNTNIPTTDEMDSITADERKALRGYCIPCKIWTPFIKGTDPEVCGECGGGFTNQSGLQITTQRTPLLGKYKAIKNERIGA